MSRRHHHHNIQPYDYARFSNQTRDRGDQARGIEYQDDSLSSINSDEESYLHHSHKDKKGGYFVTKTDTTATTTTKSIKPEKATNNEIFYQKNAKSSDTSTMERLGRLENMLEELLKRNTVSQTTAAPPPPPPPQTAKPADKSNDNKYSLDPRRHDFTTSMWINKIQETSFQNKWSEKDTIQYMGTQMSGIVKAWYKSLSNYDLTWPEWKLQITKVFPDNIDFVTTLKRLVTRLKQPDESITTYYFSKMYLIEACKITGEDAVSCLIDGLNNQTIQEQAKGHNFLTPESLYSQFLMLLPDYTVDYAPSTSTSETVLNAWYYHQQQQDDEETETETAAVVGSRASDFVEYDKETCRNNDEDFVDYRNQISEGTGDTRQHSIKSPAKRMGPVHSRLDKRFIRPNNNPFRKHNIKLPMAAKVCTICHHRGHLARQCRNADKIFSCNLTQDKGQSSCFYKQCKINGHTVTGLIDTGCTTVTIKEADARMLDLSVKSVSGGGGGGGGGQQHLQVYGGGLIRVLGQVEVDLRIDSVEARVRAVVVPNHVQEVSVVVGEEFLNRSNVCLSLRNATVKITEATTF